VAFASRISSAVMASAPPNVAKHLKTAAIAEARLLASVATSCVISSAVKL
jgi:hypothetical protein